MLILTKIASFQNSIKNDVNVRFILYSNTNWCRISFLFTFCYLDGANSIKTDLRIFNLSTGQFVQVNLCQKLLFLHQLTHNMVTDCSLNYNFNIWKFQAQIWRNQVVYCQIASDIQNNFCTQHVLPMFCKNKSFWKRFTCKLQVLI